MQHSKGPSKHLHKLQLIAANLPQYIENQQAVTTDHSSNKILLNSFVTNLMHCTNICKLSEVCCNLLYMQLSHFL